MADRPEVGSVVQHFKRVLLNRSNKDYLYEVVAYCLNATNDRECVIYRALYGNCELFVRDLEDFNSQVDKEKYPDSIQEYKFVVIGMMQTDNVTGERYIKYY